MFGFETLTCLHKIPVVRSSANKLQDVYAKAKDTSVFIRLPCNLAEIVADKSLQIALTVANPLVKPLRGPVRVIDDYAAQKLRQIESKYPAINTPTEEVVNTLNEKTEPVRNVMNSVKDSTTSTIQHGKETMSNVATATVNKASGVADSVFSFCGTHVPGIQRRDTNKASGLAGCVFSSIGALYDYVFQSIQTSLLWFRMLVVFVLLKTKQINDVVLQKMQQKPFLAVLPQRVLIIAGAFLDYFIGRIRPDDRTLADLKKSKQQSRLSQSPQYFVNRPSLKVDPSNTPRENVITPRENAVTTRQNIVTPRETGVTIRQNVVTPRETGVTTRQNIITSQQETVVTRTNKQTIDSNPQPDYSNMTDKEELYARLATDGYHQSDYHVENNEYVMENASNVESHDIAELHAQLNPTDVELLYSRLPDDILPVVDNSEPLTDDQQTLHARLIGAELERQGYQERN